MFPNNRINANLVNFVLILQHITINMMKRTFFLSFILVFLSAGLSLRGQEIPSLPDDPALTRGVLPDGIGYYIVSNPTSGARADFALVRKGRDAGMFRMMLDSLPRFTSGSPAEFLARNGISPGRRGYIRDMDGDAVLRIEDVRLSAGEAVTDSLLLMFFDMIYTDPVSEGDAVIVSGDVSADEILQKMRILSLMVPSGGSLPRTGFPEWESRDSAVSTVSVWGNHALASLSIGYSLPRTPEKYMSTAIPAVSKRLSDEFRTVLLRRLGQRLGQDSIPVADIRYTYVRSREQRGPERIGVTMLLRPGDVAAAAEAAGNVMSSLESRGASLAEYSGARDKELYSIFKNARRARIPDSEYVDKCISSFLYGASVSSAEAQERFYTKGNMPDTTGHRIFNRYIYELLDRSANLTLTCRTGGDDRPEPGDLLDAFHKGWDAAADDTVSVSCHVRQSDTLMLPVPDSRCRVMRTRKLSSVPGSEMWVFSNGMKVIYRQMPTDGVLYYSLSLRRGYASMKNMRDGEGAFMSDMPGLYSVCGIGGDDFREILETNGISMTADVSMTSTAFSGSLPRERASLLMKTLLGLSGGMGFDPQAAEGYFEEETMRLASRRGEFQAKMFVIDSIMCGTDRYSKFKSAANLREDLPARALPFFRNIFERADDGVLVFVGDVPDYEFKRFLQDYMGGFKTARRRIIKPVISYRTVSGESTYFVEGRYPGLDVLLSAELSANPDNFMATRVVLPALEDALAEALAGSAVSFSVRDSFLVYPQEKFAAAVSVFPVSPESLPASVSRADFINALMQIRSELSSLADIPLSDDRVSMYKETVKAVWDVLQDDPVYWLKVISGRFTGGKDMVSDYAERLSAVDTARINRIFRMLEDGSCMEYVIKTEEDGARSDNTDR